MTVAVTHAVVSGLFVYPVKSCRGIALNHAQVVATGLQQDRRWMVVDVQGHFVTQREQPRMALIAPELHGVGLRITAPGMTPLIIDGLSIEQRTSVRVWRDHCAAFDEGDTAAAWFSEFLGLAVRLVRFDESQPRLSSREWTGQVEAYNQFSDGFPILVISTASLAELNSRLATPLPMNRFRPNLVLEGLPAYGEDTLDELRTDSLCLRVVKPCTRCKITTTDQATGIAQGTEPISTLMTYRRNPELRGVTFGQNVIIVAGAGNTLSIGQTLQLTHHSREAH